MAAVSEASPSTKRSKGATSKATVAVLTVSDSAAQKQASDLSGPVLCALLTGLFPAAGAVATACVPDDVDAIQGQLQKWHRQGVHLVLTTGGTGFARRDVTPEAVRPLLTRDAPGLATAMLHGSLGVTPMAALARPVCGIMETSSGAGHLHDTTGLRTLVLTFPGSPKACRECFGFVAPALPHAVDLLVGAGRAVAATHAAMQGTEARAAVASGTGQRQHHGCSHGHGHGHDHGHGHGERQGRTRRGVADRERKSPYPLVPMDEAVPRALAAAAVLGTEKVPLAETLGRVLAADIFATQPLPPFRASVKV